MLVLTRRADQAIDIGLGKIIVTVLEIDGDEVKLGVDAPPDVIVDRAEVALRRAEGFQ